MAFFPGGATIYIGAADSASSDADEIQGYITDFSQSGGTRSTESIPVMGGGNVTKENPREQVEVSFEAILREDNTLLFDNLVTGAGVTSTALVDYSNDPSALAIWIEILGDDGTTYHTRGYNNVEVVNFEPTMAADGHLQGTLSLQLSPTDEDAVTNIKVANAAASGITWP